MYKLNNLEPARGARKRKNRRGRGPGSGNGTTAGRGMKGQLSRSGGGQGAWFEGGQMPIYRRVPKRGFTPRARVESSVVNLEDFERLDASREITVEYLRETGLVKGPAPRVKVLARGEIDAAYRVRVHGVSDAARRKIEAGGGSVELVTWEPVRKAGASGAARSEEK
jgi:large subunit ribosomal protein L15